MKGKSKEAKRALLDAVQFAKQAQLAAEYSKERNMLKTQEMWAIRNVEDKMAIKARYA